MPLIWNDIAAIVPTDGEIVWVRRLMYENPYTATWSAALSAFLMPNGLYLDWQWVSRWRVL